MVVLWLVVLVVAGLFGAAGLTLWQTRRIEAENPPVGRFFAVGPDGGARLHLVDLHPPAVPSGTDTDTDAEQKPVVLLLHGANVHLADMRVALGDRLAQTLRVIVPDRPGQGWSDAGGAVVSDPGHQVAMIRAAVEALGVRRLVVVGHSLGGLIALRYALEAPESVAGLVLIAPTTHPRPGGLPWFQRFAEVVIGPLMTRTVLLPLSLASLKPMVVRLFRPESPPENYAAATGLTLGLTPRRFLASLADYSDLRDHLVAMAPRYPDIDLPTVLVVGEADEVVPPAIHADMLAEVLRHRKIVRFPGAGHMLHHTRAAPIAAEILRLVDEVTPPAG